MKSDSVLPGGDLEPAPELTQHSRHGYTLWSDRAGPVEARFVGRGPQQAALELPELVRALGEAALTPAWLRQVHSAAVLPAVAGFCGDGDALVTAERKLALVVVTADCVPVLLGVPRAGGPVAAVHAGWRGLAAGMVGRAVETLTAAGAGQAGLHAEIEPAEVVAWIGPAIGPCCYEVSAEVLGQVAVASGGDEGLSTPGPRGRPHLDLPAAAERQLRAAGVRQVRTVRVCTRCHPDQLFSYRREGPGGGRNVALVWAR